MVVVLDNMVLVLDTMKLVLDNMVLVLDTMKLVLDNMVLVLDMWLDTRQLVMVHNMMVQHKMVLGKHNSFLWHLVNSCLSNFGKIHCNSRFGY